MKKISLILLFISFVFVAGCAVDSGSQPRPAADEGNVPFSNGPTYSPEDMKGPSGPTP